MYLLSLKADQVKILYLMVMLNTIWVIHLIN